MYRTFSPFLVLSIFIKLFNYPYVCMHDRGTHMSYSSWYGEGDHILSSFHFPFLLGYHIEMWQWLVPDCMSKQQVAAR